MKGCFFALFAFATLLLSSCSEKRSSPPAFDVLGSEITGLKFSNSLSSTDSFNLFKYMYFYNGAGVGAGDFNNDGKIDLFFASNQGQNRLFLNQGNLRFRDVTREAAIPTDGGWSTGVSVIDINNDGLLDIYVCQVGQFSILKGKNKMLVCEGIDENGVPKYIDRAEQMGVDFSGFSTHAAFLDYDKDGDLDLFLLNHSVHENGNFQPRSVFTGTTHPTAGNRFYRNNGNNSFTDVTKEAGISSTAIGYGLGIVVSDINMDGYPDVYIGNDFHENDYLYINQRNGTFRDNSDSSLMHTSRYTMGVDIADANNDGLPEIFSVDMLPADPYILKRSPGEDSYDVFNMKISYGYNHQYTRNALQFNRGEGLFSETALYSGIAATDWSWAPLWFDFDNDGLKDLFISNGIPKRLNDIDYINYISDQSIQEQIRDNRLDEKDRTLIDKFPEIKIPNKFYRNKGNLLFSDLGQDIKNDIGTFSNGAVYADFDNDGDLDVVVNNIDHDAILYNNTANGASGEKYMRLQLKGTAENIQAIGATVFVFAEDQLRTHEYYPVHGFMSSMIEPLHIGLGSGAVDSVIVVWPNGATQKIDTVHNRQITVSYKEELPRFDYSVITARQMRNTISARNAASEHNLLYRHAENSFPEFNREPLIPHMLSTEGPALAIADIDHNGLDDVFIGAAKGGRRALFLQEKSGRFTRTEFPAIQKDSNYEDVDALFADVNGDGHADLIVASGGNEYFNNDKHLLPRLYLNDGKANFTPKPDAFAGIYTTQSCIALSDVNGDGFPDLFIGGRSVPWQYGMVPQSYLLLNDGSGRFSDATSRYSKELAAAGFVTSAVWCDIDGDKRADLVVASEWGTIDAYVWKEDKLFKSILTDRKGWWNFVMPIDINSDGKIDLVAGNLGLNSRLHANENEPVTLYYNDFDDNGKKEQMLTYFLNGKEVPFYNKAEMERQMPDIKKRFLYAKDFAVASLEEIMTSNKMSSAVQHKANHFASSILMNKGNLQFEIAPLPWQAQLSPMRDAIVTDINKDSLPDLFVVGNYYENNIEMGRYDADYSSILINDGRGGFHYKTPSGVKLAGQARRIRKATINGNESYVIARNNDSTMAVQFKN